MPFLSERRLERINRAVVSGRIIPYLALVTLTIAVVAALAVWIFARGEFDTFGISLWWAAQTVTTVGYGDVIPQTAFSKVVAVIVMIFGITTVSLTTAVVTSALMTRVQRDFNADEREKEEEQRAQHLHALQRIEARLQALERRLG